MTNVAIFVAENSVGENFKLMEGKFSHRASGVVFRFVSLVPTRKHSILVSRDVALGRTDRKGLVPVSSRTVFIKRSTTDIITLLLPVQLSLRFLSTQSSPYRHIEVS